MDSLLNSNAFAYTLVGILTCLTTLAVAWLNRKYSSRIKPERSSQAGYSEWVAYLEREINALRQENRQLNAKVGNLERKLYDKDTLISRMKNKLLEFSRKYNEDVSSII